MSGRPMRFAISIPQSAGADSFDDDAFGAYRRRVEELGLFDSAWTQEQVIGPSESLAPLQTLTYAAACTQQVRLGCAVFVLPLHNPLHLARAISSLDWLSHGRVEVGVAGIRAVADAAAELILLNPLVDDGQQLERLAAEVIPALR